MWFRVLGPLQVDAAQAEHRPSSARRRTILAALLVRRPEAVAPDRLIDAVWGADPPPSAPKSLQSHVSRLRSELEDIEEGAGERIVSTVGGYRLRLTADDEVDAERFEELLAIAKDTVVSDPQRALAALDEACDLWRGDAYEEVAADDFARPEAIRLEQLLAVARDTRVDALLRLGCHDEAVADLEAAVDRRPLDERPHAQLMTALYRCGRQADALAVFRDYRERLVEELGLDPSPALADLEGEILRHELDTALASLGHGQTPPVASLPELDVTDLVGRDDAVESVTELTKRSRLVTVTGTGGVGKSRVAVEVCRGLAPSFSDGVVVCELGSVRDPGMVPHAVASAVGAIASADAAVLDSVVASLQGRHALLLLDNCEHVLDVAAELASRVLRRCPDVTMLATSRERLAVDGERLWFVPPLPVPASGTADLDELRASPSVRLFCERARAADPRFSLTSENASNVASICRRVDGLPLAIELAAARVPTVPLPELARRLGEGYRILAGGPRREGGRHRTLGTVVEWSYALLRQEEARLFDRLSVFAGEFTLEAAEQVCADIALAEADVVEHLPGLVDKSMLSRSDNGYRLLETLRQHGNERLEAAGKSEDLRRRHARYFSQLAQEAGVASRGPDQRHWVTVLDRQLDNLREAHGWAMAVGDVDVALRLAAPLSEYADWRLRDEVLVWAQDAARLPGAERHPLWPETLGAAARGCGNRGELATSRDLAQRGLDAVALLDDPRRILPLQALALVDFYEGDLDACDRSEQEVWRLAVAAGDRYFEAYAQAMRALAYTYGGNAPRAAECADEALRVATEWGNPTMLSVACYARGETISPADPAAALPWLERARDTARSVGGGLSEGIAEVSIGSALHRLGEPVGALRSFRRVVDRWRRLGDWTHQWPTVLNLADLFRDQGRDEVAATLLGALLADHRAARVYGADAQRMQHGFVELSERLGAEQHDRATTRGAAMDDVEVAQYATAEIEHVLAAIG